MIDVKNLNKTYGEKEAAAQVLKHVSFSLEKGCFCSIVGQLPGRANPPC